jgi:hypothetical protein
MRDYPQAPNNYVWCFSAKYPAWPRTYLSNWSSEEKTACLDAMKNGDLRVIDLSFIRMELSANEGDMHTDAHDLEEGNENQLDEHKAVKNDDKKKDMKSSAMPQDKQLCLYQKCIGKLHVLVGTVIFPPVLPFFSVCQYHSDNKQRIQSTDLMFSKVASTDGLI